MVVLKKVKGATVLETLVATIIIVVVFMLSSMILNNLFSASVKNNTQDIKTRLYKLRYLQLHNKIALPYQEAYKTWHIAVLKETLQDDLITFEATDSILKTSILETYHANH